MSVPFSRLFAGRKGKGNRLKECNLSQDFNENLPIKTCLKAYFVTGY
jgi:hypothetical protein